MTLYSTKYEIVMHFDFIDFICHAIFSYNYREATQQMILQTINRLSQGRYLFSSLTAQSVVDKNQSAVRFESQNIQWTFEELNYQTNALMKGLTSMKFKAGDNFLIRVPVSQQAEAYITKIGTAGIGANLHISTASNAEELEKQINDRNISCVVFEPTLQIGGQTTIEALSQLAPDLDSQRLGAALRLSRFPGLRSLIQTNFYSYPGVYKFRAAMNYASDRYFKLESRLDASPISLPSSSPRTPIIITDPANDFAFRSGVLNSMSNGRYVVVVEPSMANQICSEVFGNEVDFIGTSETSLNSKVRVFVEKGSGLFNQHQNRVEI